MIRTFLFAKIHRATVTASNVHYVGSITIDQALLDASDLQRVGVEALQMNVFHLMQKPGSSVHTP